MTMAQPEDHRTAKGAPFKFKVGTKSHVLPNADIGRARLTGRDLRDATMNGDVGQLAYLFKALEASEPAATALDALYGMSQDEMLEVLSAWGAHGDGDGASLGESQR